MLSLLRRFTTSSIPVTARHSAKPILPLGEYDADDERIVEFFGVPIVFPNWDPQVEREIRKRLDRLHGLTDQGKADHARELIVEYLQGDNPRFYPHANSREALAAVSAHTWKVLRAKGVVCER
jgi:hypothetical protein